MIKINLLPLELRPIKRTPVPYILSFLVLFIAVLAMAVLFVQIHGRIGDKRDELAKHEKELKDLEPTVTEWNGLVEMKRQLSEKTETINQIAKDRIVWSKQLWNLSRLTPGNFWYSGMKVDSTMLSEIVATVDPATGEKKETTQKRPVTYLVVSGYAIEGPDGRKEVSDLPLATENDQEFSKLFRFEELSFNDTEFSEGHYPVRKFELRYVVQPKKDATQPKQDAAQTEQAKQG